MTNDSITDSVIPVPLAPTSGSSLSLRATGDGTFEVFSVKRKRAGGVESAVYLVYAQSLHCSCPSGLRGGDRAGLCKHARFVDAYLSGTGPAHLESA